ncbi:MAG: alpha/beta hydrolase [Deltaproteobacteria bacterium]|nr:MAG: alpha/beta hydrolase [Deltaproteobacteria bacterium]
MRAGGAARPFDGRAGDPRGLPPVSGSDAGADPDAGRCGEGLLQLPRRLAAGAAVASLDRGGRGQRRAGAGGAACPREEFEPYFEHLSQLDLRGYFALARDLLSHDADDLLPQIDVPVLVVAGERDLFTPLVRSKEMAERIPHAELLVLREASHAAMVEQPELVALTIEKFLVSRCKC